MAAGARVGIAERRRVAGDRANRFSITEDLEPIHTLAARPGEADLARLAVNAALKRHRAGIFGEDRNTIGGRSAQGRDLAGRHGHVTDLHAVHVAARAVTAVICENRDALELPIID